MALLLWGSAVLSAIVDNIPYVATMSPVVAELVNANGGGDSARVLWWSLALGADLGGNATAVGASANVVILGLAERDAARLGQLDHLSQRLALQGAGERPERKHA